MSRIYTHSIYTNRIYTHRIYIYRIYTYRIYTQDIHIQCIYTVYRHTVYIHSSCWQIIFYSECLQLLCMQNKSSGEIRNTHIDSVCVCVCPLMYSVTKSSETHSHCRVVWGRDFDVCFQKCKCCQQNGRASELKRQWERGRRGSLCE